MNNINFENKLYKVFIGKIPSNVLSISFNLDGDLLKILIYTLNGEYRFKNEIEKELSQSFPMFKHILNIMCISQNDYIEYNYQPFKDFIFEINIDN